MYNSGFSIFAFYVRDSDVDEPNLQFLLHFRGLSFFFGKILGACIEFSNERQFYSCFQFILSSIALRILFSLLIKSQIYFKRLLNFKSNMILTLNFKNA